MNNIKWVQSSPLVNAAEIITGFEKDHNVVLPEVFKSFVVKNNCAAPIPDSITVKGFGDTDVKRLLSFNRDDTETVYQVVGHFAKAKLVPFASDSYGNYFCLSGTNIVFWEHETDTQYDLKCTFDDFLQKIH